MLMTDKQKDLWLSFFIILSVLLIYGHYLHLGSFGATGDFGPAVSYALNYQQAVHNGQWLPRWVILAREMTMYGGTIDGTAVTADSPVYQYYAFLQSALAFLFLCFKISAVVSTQLAAIVIFMVGGLALYSAGRLLGANRGLSFLSAYSYLISPWLVSNFYGRGGISEAIGQGLLPLLLLGFAFALKNRTIPAIATIALAVFALALGHNIYLLYGVMLTGILALASLKFKAPLTACILDIKIPVVLGTGVLLGLAASSWQWWPAVMTLKEVSFYYIGNFSQQYKIPTAMADLSGAWGIPQQYLEGGTIKREFFFTIGWWTIPAIVGLISVRSALRSAAFAVFLSFAIFFALTFWPAHIFPYLPGSFGATQFTFRLLAFLSVLGSFALCLVVPKLPRTLVLSFLVLITLSQLPVINFQMPEQLFPNEQYLKGYEYNAYYANSPREWNFRYWYDGWMNEENVLNLADLKDKPVYLKIRGKLRDELAETKLYVASVNNPQQVVSNYAEIKSKNFDVTLKIPKPEDNLRLYATKTLKLNGRNISIRPETVALFSHPLQSFVPASDLDRVEAYGYQRLFRLKPTKESAHALPQGTVYTIELPMIYNRFVLASQNAKPLLREIDFNHRLNVKTTDLTSPICVYYALPFALCFISISAFAVLCLLLLLAWMKRSRYA